MPEYLIDEINNFINEYIPIESLLDLNKQKLTDETFIIIIDMIPNTKLKIIKHGLNLEEFVLYYNIH